MIRTILIISAMFFLYSCGDKRLQTVEDWKIEALKEGFLLNNEAITNNWIISLYEAPNQKLAVFIQPDELFQKRKKLVYQISVTDENGKDIEDRRRVNMSKENICKHGAAKASCCFIYLIPGNAEYININITVNIDDNFDRTLYNRKIKLSSTFSGK